MFKRSVASLRESVQPPTGNPPGDGPSVCLLYETEGERIELSRRFRAAGLDEIPWQRVDLRSDEAAGAYLEQVRRWPRRLVDVLGAGSVTTITVLAAYWPLIAAVTLSIAPAFFVLKLVRGWNPSKVAAPA